jgi:hypothetical protein
LRRVAIRRRRTGLDSVDGRAGRRGARRDHPIRLGFRLPPAVAAHPAPQDRFGSGAAGELEHLVEGDLAVGGHPRLRIASTATTEHHRGAPDAHTDLDEYLAAPAAAHPAPQRSQPLEYRPPLRRT